MHWHRSGWLLRRTLRTMVLLSLLAAGAQGYGARAPLGLIATLGVWCWARRSWRSRGKLYSTAMCIPMWVQRVLFGSPPW